MGETGGSAVSVTGSMWLPAPSKGPAQRGVMGGAGGTLEGLGCEGELALDGALRATLLCADTRLGSRNARVHEI